MVPTSILPMLLMVLGLVATVAAIAVAAIGSDEATGKGERSQQQRNKCPGHLVPYQEQC